MRDTSWMMSRIILSIGLIITPVFAPAPDPGAPSAAGVLGTADPAHVKQVQEWRAKHEADYRRDWASIAGLHFLKPGVNTAGSAKSNDIVVSPEHDLVVVWRWHAHATNTAEFTRRVIAALPAK